MPEFLTLLLPDDARSLLLDRIDDRSGLSQTIDTISALGRVTAEDVVAPHPLPAFARSTVDGYAVRARDTYGANDSLPGYLTINGEVPMGKAPNLAISPGQCALIHTGGMLPTGANAVIMLEYTQPVRAGEIEIQRAVAEGENVIRIGEDVTENQVVISKGVRIRPVEIGGLMALGIQELRVVNRVKVGLISSGDEVISPDLQPEPGQVRDINSFTLAALVEQVGGEPVFYGIVPDHFELLQTTATKALRECDLVIITAGSSASTRDMTADVITTLGNPGVLVHGINTRPGKPTILGVCDGKAVIGLPGNPVSALVNGYLFVVPVIEKLLGFIENMPKPTVRARLTVNLASQTGREDWQPVKLIFSNNNWVAEPIFGKSNLIFTLAAADGLIKIHADANGVSAGEIVDVYLMS
jgi:molybdopterin molybdotransferase